MKLHCKCCGKTTELSGYAPETRNFLNSINMCYACGGWSHLVAMKDQPTSVRYKGMYYTIGPEDAKGFRGFGGQKYIIHFNDGRIVTTTNLWSQGSIPERFRELLPDNAHKLETPAILRVPRTLLVRT